MKKPYCKYDYFAGDILKVWDCVVQSRTLQYYYDEERKSLTSLFENKESMTPKWASGIVTDNQGQLFGFTYLGSETKYSVSICQSVDPYESLTYLERAWEQIQRWQLLEKTLKIKRHAILFPYHQGPHHWNLGVLWLIFSEEVAIAQNLTKIELEIYEPLYSTQKLCTIFLSKIKALFSFENILWNVIPTNQQSDATSCGPISATNGTHFLGYSLDGQSLLSVIYKNYAQETRQWHISLIGDHFAELQHQEQEYDHQKSSKDTVISVQHLEVKQKFVAYLQTLAKGEQQIIVSLYESLLKDDMLQDEIARDTYQNIKDSLKKNKEQLTQLTLEKSIDDKTNVFSYFLKADDGWQDNAIDTLYKIAAEIASDKAQTLALNQKEGAVLNDYEKRSTLTKSFPGPLYQCLLALHYMLLLSREKTEFTIRMEDADSGAFDDIVIQSDNEIQYIQIKHKYNNDDEYKWGDFTNLSGDVELDKYFDDWYLFIKTGSIDATKKHFTFHSSGKLDLDVKNYLQYDNEKKCYFFKKHHFRCVNKEPAIEEIKGDEIVIYLKEKTTKRKTTIPQCQAAFLYYIKNGTLLKKEVTRQLSCEMQKSLLSTVNKNESLANDAEKEIQYLIYCYFMPPIYNKKKKEFLTVIDKIKENSLICNKDLFKEKIEDFFGSSKQKKSKRKLQGEKETGGNNPTVAELRNRFKGYQEKKWQPLTPTEININIAEFLEGLQLKFEQDHIAELEVKVKQQVKEFVGEAISSDNVYHALVMETHRWLCNMKTKPWDRTFVEKKLRQFKTRYIELVHKIGESQLSFRQINHLALYHLYNLFAEEFNVRFREQVKVLLEHKDGQRGLLFLSIKDVNEGSILIEQYLQSKFNELIFGEYLYFDGRYLREEIFQLAEEKELKLIVIDRVDEWVASAASVGKLWESVNDLLSKGKKIILISSEKTIQELHQRLSATLPIFDFNMKRLEKDDVMKVIKQSGGNSIVSLGDRAFDLSQADWKSQSSISQVFGHLPTLIHALTFTNPKIAKKTTEPIPLMLEEEISLYAFSAVLSYLKNYRKAIAIVISSEEEFRELQSQLTNLSAVMIAASDLLDQNFKGLEAWLTRHYLREIEIFKKEQLTIIVDSRQHSANYETLARILAYPRCVILTGNQEHLSIPLLKLTQDKEVKSQQSELMLEFCNWHMEQNKFERMSKTITRDAGENRLQLIQLARQSGHVVICAEGGSGKSTIVRALYDDWCNETSAFSHYWLVFIQLGRLKITDADKELIELIKDAYVLQEIPWQLNLLSLELQQKRVIFMLDGWDELQPYQKKQLSQLVKKLVGYEKVIWTTRPSEVLSLPVTPRKQFNLGKFDKNKVTQFLHDKFPESQDFANDAINYIVTADNQSLLDLVSLPLHCHLLCEIWQPYYQLFSQDKTTPLPWKNGKKFNKITLYQEFVKTRLWRYLITISKVKQQTAAAFELQERIFLFCNQHLARLQKIAYHLSFTNRINCVYQKLLDHDLQKTAIVFSPELVEYTTLPVKSTISFYFTHKTYEEYLSAVFLAQQLVQGDKNERVAKTIKTYRYHPDYMLRWEFLAAIVSFGDPIVPNVGNVLGRFWTLLLAEPRDLIGVAENELLNTCLSNTCFDNFDNKEVIDFNQKIVEQLRPWYKEYKAIPTAQSSVEKKDEAPETQKVVSNDDQQQIAEVEFTEPWLPSDWDRKIMVLQELEKVNYTINGKLAFLCWLKKIYPQQLYNGVRIKKVCDAIENIVEKVLNKTNSELNEFFNNPNILEITFAIIGSWEVEDYFRFIENMRPTDKQIQQMLTILAEPTISKCMTKAILTCLIHVKERIKEEIDLNLINEILNNKKSFITQKLGCCCILRQYGECRDDMIFQLLLKLLQTNIDHLPVVFSMIKQLGYINAYLRENFIKTVYDSCIDSMRCRLKGANNLTKSLTKKCLLFLDYCSALDNDILKVLFDENQDYGYWDCDVVIPVIEGFVHTFNLEIFNYLSRKREGKFAWPIQSYTFIKSSLRLFAEMSDKFSKITVLRAILSLYDEMKFHIAFENVEPLELMQLTLEVYIESVKDKKTQLTQQIIKFIFNYCSHLEIALVIDEKSVNFYFNKETRVFNDFPYIEELTKQISDHRSANGPKVLQLLPAEHVSKEELNDSDEDFHEPTVSNIPISTTLNRGFFGKRQEKPSSNAASKELNFGNT